MSINDTPITLWCLEYGSGSFFVTIGNNKSIFELKKAIFEEISVPDNVKAKNLRLWSVNVEESQLESNTPDDLMTDDNEIKIATQKVCNTFHEVQGDNIRVIVRVPVATEQPVAELLVSAEFKRNYEEEQDRNVKKIRKYPSPSSFAQIANLYESQLKEAQDLLIYRPSDCVSTPVILYNPAFILFKINFDDERLHIDKKHNQWTLKCIKSMADFYSDENRQSGFHELIRELLNKDVKVLVLDDRSSNDGTLELDFHSYSVLYLLIEIKNEIGTGKCDPTIQAAASYAKFYAQEKNQKLLKGCNLPCFIIGLAGPWICILGAVYVEKPLVEPLTGFEPLIFINDRIHLNKIARLFKALSLGCDELKEYYGSLTSSVLDTVDNQRFFPFIRGFTDITFNYTEKLFNDPSKLLWKAVTNEGHTIVVKYTYRYNRKAHKLCHDIGKAPKLIHAEKTKLFLMIIMEYVEGQRLCDCCDLKDSEYKKILQDIEEAVVLLHDNGIVFADLRDSNILVIKNEDEYHGMLVDFDWAGKDSVSIYPDFMNADVDWPTGAEDNEKLKKEHDIYWLDVLKKKYLNNVANE